ncbi:PAS domain-containing protein [bacterium]|nr:PAS domain-containing protein [bacterium]
MQSDYLKKIVGHISNLDRKQIESLVRKSVANEQFLDLILNSMMEAIIAVDETGTVIFANSSAYDLTGIRSRNLLDKPLINNIRDAALREILQKTDLESFYTFEVKVKYPRLLSLVVQTIPIQKETAASSGNNNLTCLILIRDATYECTQNTTKARETRLETMRLLTAGVAHEIGNPLGAIILHTQLMDRIFKRMADTPEMDELKQINHVVNEESTRLKRIVADFLNAVRPLSTKFEFSDITNIFDETFLLLNEELKNKKITLIKDFYDVPKTMLDADQMRSVIINIVRNATDAMSNGGELTVSLNNKGNWIEITFSDTGEGMDETQMKRIFDPFFTTKTNGSGLGLLIVQRIINSHNGTVKVDSVPDHGTAITIELPVRSISGKKSLPLPK